MRKYLKKQQQQKHAHAYVFSEARRLSFGQSPCFQYASSEGSCESVHMRRSAWPFAARRSVCVSESRARAHTLLLRNGIRLERNAILSRIMSIYYSQFGVSCCHDHLKASSNPWSLHMQKTNILNPCYSKTHIHIMGRRIYNRKCKPQHSNICIRNWDKPRGLISGQLSFRV